MKGDRERCIAAGMDGYLAKPIRPQELDEMLDRYLDVKPPLAELIEACTLSAETVRVDELLERIDGDRNFLAELLDVLRANYPAQVCAGREAVATNDAAGLQRVAHSLKGAFKNLAAPTASDLAAELESMGRRSVLRLRRAR